MTVTSHRVFGGEKLETKEQGTGEVLPQPESGAQEAQLSLLESEVLQQPESRPDLQPESLKKRVITLLVDEPMSKSGLSPKLGQKEISGQLNRVIRMLLDDKIIEYTIPYKPNSRLQKHRLPSAGGGLLGKH